MTRKLAGTSTKITNNLLHILSYPFSLCRGLAVWRWENKCFLYLWFGCIPIRWNVRLHLSIRWTSVELLPNACSTFAILPLDGVYSLFTGRQRRVSPQLQSLPDISFSTLF